MDAYRAVSIAEGLEDDASEDEVLEAWQYLVDSGLAWSLQGAFGRQAARLIEAGLLTAPEAR